MLLGRSKLYLIIVITAEVNSSKLAMIWWHIHASNCGTVGFGASWRNLKLLRCKNQDIRVLNNRAQNYQRTMHDYGQKYFSIGHFEQQHLWIIRLAYLPIPEFYLYSTNVTIRQFLQKRCCITYQQCMLTIIRHTVEAKYILLLVIGHGNLFKLCVLVSG